MNILFLMKTFDVGGIEMVTIYLANSFSQYNHRVSIVSFNNATKNMVSKLNKSISFYQLKGYNSSKENVSLLHKIFEEQKVDIIINQWGLPYIPILTIKKAIQGSSVKIISIYHNSPNTNARIKYVEIALENATNKFKRALLISKKECFKFLTRISMRYVYQNSDIYMVLSNRFINQFVSFTGISNPNKLKVLTNPVSIDNSTFSYSLNKKQMEIIYVGRIDYNQKRVFRVIEVWTILEKKYPNWKLIIVGDGIEKNNIENQVEQMGLKNIVFKGYQDPEEYYKRASILVLTSEYEGFPLVVPECMCFGVVPIVYASYSAAYDIIQNKTNGLLIESEKGRFNPVLMANAVSSVIDDAQYRDNLAKNAIETSNQYSIRKITDIWNNLFNNLKK